MEAISAAAAVGSLAYSAYAGERGRSMQKKSLVAQEQGQRDALTAARAAEARAAEEAAKINRKRPDITALLLAEQRRGGQGTTLAGGLAGDRMAVSRPSMLGTA